MLNTLDERMDELRAILDRIEDATAEGKKPPGMLVARAAVAADECAARLACLAGALEQATRENPQ